MKIRRYWHDKCFEWICDYANSNLRNLKPVISRLETT